VLPSPPRGVGPAGRGHGAAVAGRTPSPGAGAAPAAGELAAATVRLVRGLLRGTLEPQGLPVHRVLRAPEPVGAPARLVPYQLVTRRNAECLADFWRGIPA
jgi:hypothetical protein